MCTYFRPCMPASWPAFWLCIPGPDWTLWSGWMWLRVWNRLWWVHNIAGWAPASLAHASTWLDLHQMSNVYDLILQSYQSREICTMLELSWQLQADTHNVICAVHWSSKPCALQDRRLCTRPAKSIKTEHAWTGCAWIAENTIVT